MHLTVGHPTRVDSLNLLVPWEREDTFSTWKVAEVGEVLCGTSFPKTLFGKETYCRDDTVEQHRDEVGTW